MPERETEGSRQRSLSTYVSTLAGTTSPYSLLDLPISRQLRSVLNNEDRTQSTVASLFWNVVFPGDTPHDALRRRPTITPRGEMFLPKREEIVVANGPTNQRRYDLVVLDVRHDETVTVPLEVSRQLVTRRASEYQNLLREQTLRFTPTLIDAIVDVVSPKHIHEVLSHTDFKVIRMPMPERSLTCCPCPPAEIIDAIGKSSASGALVRDQFGRRGVTASLHAVSQGPTRLASPGSHITVGGRPGRIISTDPTTDSCFVEVDTSLFSSSRGARGILAGMCPRGHEAVSFHSPTTPSGYATIDSWDKPLPLVLPFNQAKVYTNAVTSPGDSGAALVDSNDQVVGFSFWTTTVGQPIALSAWMWADSVMQAHGLSTI